MSMRSFMTTNVYSFSGTILITGACLPEVDSGVLEPLVQEADQVFSLCLEETHFNMALAKFTAVMGTGQVRRVLLASVDRSPHCTQLHYLAHELERVCPDHVPVESYVLHEHLLVPVPPEAIDLSKSLFRLSRMTGK